MAELCEVIESGVMVKVESLHLGDNKIGDAGCAALAEAVAKGCMPAIKEIPLGRHNPASDAAMQSVKDAVKKSHK